MSTNNIDFKHERMKTEKKMSIKYSNLIGAISKQKNSRIIPVNMIESLTTTSYEKVLRYLKELNTFFNSSKVEKIEENERTYYSENIKYIIDTIISQNLYSYSSNVETNTHNNQEEIDSFIGYLNTYSSGNVPVSRKNYKSSTCMINDHSQSILVKMVKETETSLKNKVQSNSNLNQVVQSDTFVEPDSIDMVSKKSINSELTASTPEINKIFNFSPSKGEKSNKLDDEIQNILDKNFNIFKYIEQNGELNLMNSVVTQSLKELDNHLKLDKPFNELIEYGKLNAFCVSVRESYLKNPYHNHIHGTDVFHTLFQILIYSNITNFSKISTLDVISCLIAGLVHDIGHPGFNNNFMNNSKSELSLTYNDQSVLENYHASLGYKILIHQNTNILDKLTIKEMSIFRKRFIQTILSTDPAQHSKISGIMKNKLLNNEHLEGYNLDGLVSTNRAYEDQQEILDFLISFSDTSHNTKLFEITFEWTSRLTKEFWHQGDVEKELNLPVSFLCDRSNAYIGKGQLGFLQGIISPGVTMLCSMCPSLIYLKEQLYNNIKSWQECINIEEKKNFN